MSGPPVGVVAVQRDRVERRRQPLRRHAVGEQVEAAVGAERVALAGEHPRRVLVLALEGEHAGGEREAPGHVLPQAASAGSRRRPRTTAARPCGSSCRTARSSSARCGSPCRGSSPRTRRPRTRPSSSATCRGASSRAGRASRRGRRSGARGRRGPPCTRSPRRARLPLRPRPAVCRVWSLHSAAIIAFAARSCCRSRAIRVCAAAHWWYWRSVSAISAR